MAINAASAAIPTSGIFDSLRIRGCGTYMRDLALFEWSGLIFANDTSDARYHVSHFRQRRVSFLRIRDAAEILSQLKGHFWDVFSVECLIGKRRPTLRADCGMHFPVLLSLGKCIPFLDRIMGRNFPLERLWESVSHFDRPEWDALSAKHLNGKLRPIPKANSGTHFSKACPSGKPIPLWTHPGTEPSTYQASHQ